MAVKKEFQRWLLVRIMGSVLVSAGVAALILYFYSRQELGDSFYTAHVTVRRVSDLLLPVILAGAGVSLVSGMILALFLPQKIAGPLYRVEQEMARVGEGDLTVSIVLRRDDTLQDFVTVLNGNVDSLRGRVAAVKLGLQDLEPEGLSAPQLEAIRKLAEIKV